MTKCQVTKNILCSSVISDDLSGKETEQHDWEAGREEEGAGPAGHHHQ